MAFCLLTKCRKYFKKIKSFAHGEFNKHHLADEKKIKERIDKGEDVFERGFKIKRINIDDSIQITFDIIKIY